MKRLTSIEVSAMHALGHSFDEECVAWAVSELVAGRDSPGLRVLAGEGPPFNQFEIASLVDRTLNELEIARFESGREAVLALTHELARQIVADDAQPGDALSRINRVYGEADWPGELFEFTNLYNARHDLIVEGEYHSWYRTDCTPETIDAVILEECARWMESHPHGPWGKANSG